MSDQKAEFVIVGAGDLSPGDLAAIAPGSFLCAADAGFLPLREAGLALDLLVGDFDSMAVSGQATPKPAGCRVISLPVEKDDTDVAYCIKEGFRLGFSRFLLLGVLGGARISHSFANLQLLSFVRSQGGSCRIFHGGTELFTLCAGEEHRFAGCPGRSMGGTLSVFSLSDSAEITLFGFQYPLDKGKITRCFPLGVSNHFTGEAAVIAVHAGEVLVIREDAE